MTIIDQIASDREAGTRDGWKLKALRKSHVIMCPTAPKDETYNHRIAEFPQWSWGKGGPDPKESAANARRCARVPKLEALALAGAELAEAVGAFDADMSAGPEDTEASHRILSGETTERLRKALTAWKALTDDT